MSLITLVKALEEEGVECAVFGDYLCDGTEYNMLSCDEKQVKRAKELLSMWEKEGKVSPLVTIYP